MNVSDISSSQADISVILEVRTCSHVLPRAINKTHIAITGSTGATNPLFLGRSLESSIPLAFETTCCYILKRRAAFTSFSSPIVFYLQENNNCFIRTFISRHLTKIRPRLTHILYIWLGAFFDYFSLNHVYGF